MCLVSILLKEIRGRWIRKYQVLLFFMLRQLKTTACLRMGHEVAWNLAVSEANLSRGSTKHSFYKTFPKKKLWNLQRKTCVRKNILPLSKEDSGTGVFLWMLKFFKNKLFLQNAFRSLLLLFEKSLRKYTKPTNRMLLESFKNTWKEICFSNVSDLYRELTFLDSIIQQLFSLNI